MNDAEGSYSTEIITWLTSLRPQVASCRINTLGPHGTSSEHAAEFLAVEVRGQGLRCQIRLHCSFEVAAEDVSRLIPDNVRSVAVVANAYGFINRFYMNPRLTLIGTFNLRTPAYGLAARPGWMRAKGAVAMHPACEPLLEEFLQGDLEVAEVVAAASTSAAAKMVAEHRVPMALTNKTSVAEHGLVFVSSTRSFPMVWSVFGPENPLVGRSPADSSQPQLAGARLRAI
jgi:prephenate dehydratase